MIGPLTKAQYDGQNYLISLILNHLVNNGDEDTDQEHGTEATKEVIEDEYICA